MENKLYDILLTPHNSDYNPIMIRGEYTKKNVHAALVGDFGDAEIVIFNNHTIEVEISGQKEYFDIQFMDTYQPNRERDAKETLRDMGYFTDMMWSTSDVTGIEGYEHLTDEQATEILRRTFKSEYIGQTINEEIEETAEKYMNELSNDYEEK